MKIGTLCWVVNAHPFVDGQVVQVASGLQDIRTRDQVVMRAYRITSPRNLVGNPLLFGLDFCAEPHQLIPFSDPVEPITKITRKRRRVST